MREGIHWRGNQRLRHGQEDNDNPIENVSLLSRLHNRRRASKFIILCLFLCIMTWTMSRTLQSMFPISIERPEHQVATQGIMFEMFRYYIHGQANNMTFNAMHRRRRRRQSVQYIKDNLDLPSRYILESETQEICDDDEHETKPFNRKGDEVSPSIEYDQSLKKRRGSTTKEDSSSEDPSSTIEALGHLPLLGGKREAELDIEAFYVKVPIGYGTNLVEYFMHIDTGSGITWVMCRGRGPITAVGPNGLFKPKKETFLDCRNDQLCLKFQEGVNLPCDKKNHFNCLFDHEYGDGLDVKGYAVMGDVSLTQRDGSQLHVHISFGCADKVNDENTKDKGKNTQLTDGLIGLGPHPASWLQQLNDLGLILEHVVAICFEPHVKDESRIHIEDPLLPTSAGFLSFGNSYASQAVNTVWTANIPVQTKDGEMESMYIARLVAIKYRTRIIRLQEPNRRRKRDADQSPTLPGVKMGFDSGSDLTYFTKAMYHDVVQLLNREAKSKGYRRAKDSNEFVKEEQRMCWSNGEQKIPVTEFGDLVLMFASLANDGTTSDMVIKPQYYITLGGSRRHQRTCFNMLKEADFDYGNIGGMEFYWMVVDVCSCFARPKKSEVMKGHIFFFNNDLNKIGWHAVKSCKNLN